MSRRNQDVLQVRICSLRPPLPGLLGFADGTLTTATADTLVSPALMWPPIVLTLGIRSLRSRGQ